MLVEDKLGIQGLLHEGGGTWLRLGFEGELWAMHIHWRTNIEMEELLRYS